MSTCCIHGSTAEAPVDRDPEAGQADPSTVRWRIWSLTWQHGVVGRAVSLESQSLSSNSRPTSWVYHFGLTFWQPKLPASLAMWDYSIIYLGGLLHSWCWSQDPYWLFNLGSMEQWIGPYFLSKGIWEEPFPKPLGTRTAKEWLSISTRTLYEEDSITLFDSSISQYSALINLRGRRQFSPWSQEREIIHGRSNGTWH